MADDPTLTPTLAAHLHITCPDSGVTQKALFFILEHREEPRNPNETGLSLPGSDTTPSLSLFAVLLALDAEMLSK